MDQSALGVKRGIQANRVQLGNKEPRERPGILVKRGTLEIKGLHESAVNLVLRANADRRGSLDYPESVDHLENRARRVIQDNLQKSNPVGGSYWEKLG